MKKPLGTDIEELRADFASVRGEPFEHSIAKHVAGRPKDIEFTRCPG